MGTFFRRGKTVLHSALWLALCCGQLANAAGEPLMIAAISLPFFRA
ncbi:MAG TPA: hypothetical protein VEM38_07895 [Burkholderiales bacterium]|nr:hypothetical protein [Burkholderiales bacterium]